jgi:hypothetical protein
MERETIDRLVERLGMMHELSPLLKYERGYGRVENALNHAILCSLGRDIMPKIRAKKGKRIILIGKSPIEYERSVEMFMKYFGIGENPTPMKDIAIQYEVSRSFVGQNIDFVSKFLKQKYSREIKRIALD